MLPPPPPMRRTVKNASIPPPDVNPIEVILLRRAMTVTVAYMGITRSNFEQAAVEFAAKMEWDEYELLPRINSRASWTLWTWED